MSRGRSPGTALARERVLKLESMGGCGVLGGWDWEGRDVLEFYVDVGLSRCRCMHDHVRLSLPTCRYNYQFT